MPLAGNGENGPGTVFRLKEKYGTTGVTRVYADDGNEIVELKKQAAGGSATLFAFFQDAFVPQGYPRSVSRDYFDYQLFDTLQAFCSRITGTITTKAVLKGVGVGNAEATPLAAAITWIFKDGTGMIGSILFAWWKGTEFDADCKKWRFFADILNDSAMCVEMLLLPFCTGTMTTPVLCLTTVMKAGVGVAGSATRAAITQHQAIRGNMADVSAKDGSQETAVNLTASVFGLLVLAYVDEGIFEWALFVAFTFLHLYANYRAVSSLVLVTLNKTRMNAIVDRYLRSDDVPTPEEVNRDEPVLLGITAGKGETEPFGFRITLGQSLKRHLRNDGGGGGAARVSRCCEIYERKMYAILPRASDRSLDVCFRASEKAIDVIEAQFHAALLATAVRIVREDIPPNGNRALLGRLRRSLAAANLGKDADVVDVCRTVSPFVDEEFVAFARELGAKGWSTDRHSLRVDEWRLQPV